jgi:hypothetical protein
MSPIILVAQSNLLTASLLGEAEHTGQAKPTAPAPMPTKTLLLLMPTTEISCVTSCW